MCGIAGQIYFNAKSVEKTSLKQMAAFMQERGPDHTGIWQKNNIGLVHTRLAIIDLDERSNQPMLSDNQKIVLTFNGEIYNFPTVKKELEELGHSFRTSSDTEVIIKGYQEWGMDGLLQRISGMFAMGLYDQEKERFFLVRDFFGKKPLYYFYQNQELLFASDIRAIASLKKAVLSLDYESLDYYLVELSSPQPKTIWNEIQQLPPAHYLEFNLKTAATKLQQYWVLKPSEQNISFEEALEGTEKRLKEAIGRRTIADVPIGCFLSGGVDSGLVVALLAQQSSTPVSTYSIGLNYEAMNELPDAKIVADRYSTNHHEIILEVDVLKDLPKLIEYYGEPFADSSMLPSFYVTKAIAKSVRVALSGDGGDELFGGYNDYGIAFRTDQYLKAFPNPSFRKIRTLLDKIIARVVNKKENMGAYEHYNQWTGARRLYRQMGFDVENRKSLYHVEGPLAKQNFAFDYLNRLWTEHLQDSLTSTLLLTSLKTRLLNDYLVKVDRASMFNSLEVRSPFLDKDLAEWAFSLPNQYKFKGNVNKYLLKRLAEKHIDPNISKRPKRGFGIPVHKWLQKEMYEWMKSILLGGSLAKRKLFNMAYIEKIIEEHRQYANHSHRLWALICLELWFQKFVDLG